MSCRQKRAFLDSLAKALTEISKKDANPATITLVESLSSLADNFRPRIACSPLSPKLWDTLNNYLSELLSSDLPKAKRMVENLRDSVLSLQMAELSWQQRTITILGALAALTFLVTGPSLPFYGLLGSSMIAIARPIEGGILSVFWALFLSVTQPILGALVAFAAMMTTFSFVPPSLNLEVPKVEVEAPSEEEVLKLFEEVYGRKGRDLFYFELKQLMIYGMTKEEALSELWKRLVGETT
ncbi:hypothetical protein IPA_09190 [Ignicoccus pacificus DSM 13166]|uniref:Uncharacterized protein n=1 Tax=Ignicoccus pacificus DSM 13166 TaxID=940294 RepID=A0A977KC44_9CREN|nr:hypothetical protein IPA_09190 [Ignicoccus pacificus DSM 13166]